MGGGGHAVVVAEAVRLCGLEVVGFLDDSPDAPLGSGEGKGLGSAPRLGRLADLNRIPPTAGWFLALGDLAKRRSLLAALAPAGARSIGLGTLSIVHPEAFVSPTACVGLGVFVGARAIVHTRAVVHDHAIINTAAIIEHDCAIHDNTHVAPGSILGGGTVVGPDTLIGIGSRSIPRVRVGARAVVGCGSVLIRDIADGAKVAGVPAHSLDQQ
jgi:sugar O-acyltransferase (sialic acid O-acetyltransferase NeuD family)